MCAPEADATAMLAHVCFINSDALANDTCKPIIVDASSDERSY